METIVNFFRRYGVLLIQTSAIFLEGDRFLDENDFEEDQIDKNKCSWNPKWSSSKFRDI